MAAPFASSHEDEAWDARLHLEDVLAYVNNWSGRRCVHFFDLFAGVGEASKAFQAKNYEVRSFDLEEGDDMVSREGFFKALDIVLSMEEGGLILLGPPCSLWVFFSSPFHKRTALNADGDLSKPAVRSANTLVRNVCLLLCIGHWRSLYFILEQPSSSRMHNFRWISWLCQALSLRRVFTWMRCFGHEIPKPTYLLSNLTSAARLRRVWSQQREMNRKAGRNHILLICKVCLGYHRERSKYVCT